MEAATLAYKRQFSAYEYLWTTDLQAMFREFLKCAYRLTSGDGLAQSC